MLLKTCDDKSRRLALLDDLQQSSGHAVLHDLRISAEGKFCWNNAKRFGGQQYCREHQTRFG